MQFGLPYIGCSLHQLMDNICLWKGIVETVQESIDFAIMSSLYSYLCEIKMNGGSNKILHKLESFIFILRKEKHVIFSAM